MIIDEPARAAAHVRGETNASPGEQSVQPHGIFMVLSEPDLLVETVSANIEALSEIAPHELLGQRLDAFMHATEARTFVGQLREPLLANVNPRLLTLIGRSKHERQFECTVARRAGGGLSVELELTDAPARPAPYTDVHAPIERLQSAGDITSLLRSAAHDMREMSGFERVVVYRFATNRHGDAVAQADAPEIDALVGQPPASIEISPATRTFFSSNSLLVVPDAQYVGSPLISHDAATSARPIDLTRATLRSAPPDALACIRAGGNRAACTFSIVIGEQLWGLIVATHRTPRPMYYAQRAVCELLGRMLEWQLGVRLEAELHVRRTRDATLHNQISAQLDSHPDVAAALIACAPQVIELFAASGIAVQIGNAFSCYGAAPGDALGARTIAVAVSRRDAAAVVTATDRLAALLLESPGSPPAGALCIRLSEDGRDFLLIYRSPAPSAGSAEADVRAVSLPWTDADFEAAETLAKRMLLRVGHLTRTRAEHITHLNANLERRNAQAEALIVLQDDVAAALPSRTAVIEVILAFAQRQVPADGCSFEIITAGAVVCEAATGVLAPRAGSRQASADTFSGRCAELHQTLVSSDIATETDGAEREFCAHASIMSLLAVPITLAPETTVILKVAALRRWAFNDNDTQTLKLAATTLRSALRAAQKFTALAAAELEQRTYARQLRALHAIASTTTSHRKDQIDAALHLGLAQLGLNWAFLGVIDHAAQEFVIESSVSDDDVLVARNGARMPLTRTIVGQAADSRGVIIVQDVAALLERPLFSGWKSFIAVPLFIGRTKYGLIGFTSREVRPEPFSDANIEFIAVAGELIASAIERGLQRDQLENSEMRYRALSEAIPQMLWVIDANNQFEYVNERFTAYSGLTLDDTRDDGSGMYHPDDVDELGLQAALPAVECDFEVRVRRADGVYHWHLLRSVPFRGMPDDREKWLVTATDIESRKSAETLLADVHDAALAATEAKSRFLATMSHEIRTPMNGVIGMTELLLLTSLNDEQREYTGVIRDSGQSLLRVLNDILDYSKIEAGKLELETVEFDLPGQIESVVELLRPGFTAKDVALSTIIAPDVRTGVVGDPGRLRQILLNLTGNALKFTAGGGRVEIFVSTGSAEADTCPVRFTIKDTGIGMIPEVLERLFQPFSQGDESTTRKYGGTGLGLSISAELVALMGGEIGVASVAGRGSEFWFVIPFRLAPNSQKVADARKRSPRRSQPAPIRSERILLVEDNEINTFLALKQLQRLGFAVTAVIDGRRAVETVAREDYDLVLMDCHMPEMDGFEATRAIRRAEPAGAHLPIVAMTADARDEDHQNCLLAGMDDFITKPTNLDSLKGVLDRWLPAPERRRASRPGTQPLSAAPTLGMAMLLEIFNGDRNAVIDLLTAALGSINGDFKRIEVAAAERDFETVIEAAHRLKGTGGSIRSARLVEICSAIQSQARAEPATIPLALLAELRAGVSAVTAEIASLKKGVDSGRNGV